MAPQNKSSNSWMPRPRVTWWRTDAGPIEMNNGECRDLGMGCGSWELDGSWDSWDAEFAGAAGFLRLFEYRI